MKYKIVLVPFPFDDLSSQKVRPALCLTDKIKPYDHLVLAFITSRVPQNPSSTDLILNSEDEEFALTGLKVSSAVRTHRLMTVSKEIIKSELGSLSSGYIAETEKRLRSLFGI